jgi:hypothetical protein
MYLSFGKINIGIKGVIIGVVSIILSVLVAYYLISDEDNRLETFSDYLNLIFGKMYFIYVVIFMTIVFYNILHFLFDNRESIKREIRSRGQTIYNKTLGPNFINRSIRGGVNATNKIYDYSGRAYNYLRPNRAQINPTFNVEPLYAQTEYPKSYNPFD